LDSLGWVLFRQNRLKEAKTYLERAKELRDGRDSAVIWDHLGDTLFKMDDIAGAKQSWQKALELAKQAPRSDKEARPVDIERKLKVLGRE
jgi:Tfp pilus assembly protein PilF